MEKGKIKIHKSGKVKKCVNSNNKGVSVPAIFDFSQFCPSDGTNEYECELETDDKGKVNKLLINNINVPFLEDKLKEREQKEKKAEEKEKNELKRKEELEANKHLIDFYKNDFVSVNDSFVPVDTKNKLSKNEWQIDNFNLKLNKLPRKDGDKFQFFKTDRKGVLYEPKQKFSLELINQIANDEKSNAKQIFKEDKAYEVVKLKPNWRLIVGLGHESVYEVSITLHHIYGIPYIPASAVKGVVRSYIIQEVFGENAAPEEEKDFSMVNAEYRAYQNESFCRIFGCPPDFEKVVFDDGKPKKKKKNNKEVYVTEKHKTKLAEIWKEQDKKFTGYQGKIIFFDSFPVTEPKIEVDIMNVHYPEYYGRDKPPTDTQNPNPIPFLTVAKTDFQFIIGTKYSNLEDYKIQGKAIDVWLREALSEHGIGAKTAVGYGRMS